MCGQEQGVIVHFLRSATPSYEFDGACRLHIACGKPNI